MAMGKDLSEYRRGRRQHHLHASTRAVQAVSRGPDPVRITDHLQARSRARQHSSNEDARGRCRMNMIVGE